MTDAEITRDIEIRPSSYLLWISIFAGPVSFAINMQSRFALIQWACFGHREWVLHVITLTAFLAEIGGAVLGWIAFVRLDDRFDRARFMAMSGFILSAIFALTTLALAIPHLFLRPCD
jgi:hypothetical protein